MIQSCHGSLSEQSKIGWSQNVTKEQISWAGLGHLFAERPAFKLNVQHAVVSCLRYVSMRLATPNSGQDMCQVCSTRHWTVLYSWPCVVRRSLIYGCLAFQVPNASAKAGWQAQLSLLSSLRLQICSRKMHGS